jgi:hypothetical protein
MRASAIFCQSQSLAYYLLLLIVLFKVVELPPKVDPSVERRVLATPTGEKETKEEEKLRKDTIKEIVEAVGANPRTAADVKKLFTEEALGHLDQAKLDQLS